MRALVFLFVLWPQIGFAQVANIRSGEHADFSRLVVETSAGSDWSISEVPGGYRVTLGTGIQRIDTSNVFNLIPRTRIAAAQAAGNALTLTTPCACYLSAFLIRPGSLVIDVIDGAPPAIQRFPSAFVLPLRAARARPMSRPGDPVTTEGLSDIEQVSSRRPAARVSLPLLPERQARDTLVLTPIAPVLPPVAPDPALTEAERAILESFARAATQGIFDFPARPVLPNATPDRPIPGQLTPITDPMDGVPIPLTQSDPLGPGFVLRSGIDRGTDDSQRRPATCPAPGTLDLATWGENGAFSTLIPQLRADVTNAADHDQRDALIALAKAYVFYGFGREALQALHLAGDGAQEIPFVAALAQIVDNRPLRPADLLPYRACGTDIEAWIVLASGQIDTQNERRVSGIFVTHRGLPDALRGHLGVRLAEIFTQSGEPILAQRVLQTAQAATTGGGYAATVADINLEALTGGAQAEAAALDAMLNTTTRARPADMVRRLELALQNGEAISPDTLALAQALRFEADGNHDAIALAEVEVRALAAMADFDAARSLWDDTSPDMTPAQMARSFSDIAVNMAQYAPDAPFLLFAFEEPSTPFDAAAATAVAGRLSAVGFPAQTLLVLAASDPITPDMSFLMAQSHAALGQSADALIALDGLAGADAAALRNTVLGLSDPEGQDTTPDGAWRDGQWADLQVSDDQLLRDAAEALLSDPAPPNPDAPLDDSRGRLAAAADTRALAQDLLTRFPIEESPPPVQ